MLEGVERQNYVGRLVGGLGKHRAVRQAGRRSFFARVVQELLPHVQADYPGGAALKHLDRFVADTAPEVDHRLAPNLVEELPTEEDFEFASVAVGTTVEVLIFPPWVKARSGSWRRVGRQ